MDPHPRLRRAAIVVLAGAALLPGLLAAQQVYPLRFQAGSSNASANGQLKAPNEPARDYAITTTPGTTLNVTLKTQSPGTYFSVLDPYGTSLYTNEGDQRTSWSGRLIDGGNHRVRVFLDEASQRQAKGATYTISVSVEPPR